ncbi:cbb3-type cytochrome oxidase subunit 3 [Wielerella bovis]|uniref:cbb3-type cytochrome oxidase subunit 3 n=1 Tax=Wielerella bovis TaxID=2917790 RepID=UPI0020189FEE|nr:CcoQ/FixQ family Cbb3-type cytochrome c oxidase assembly chaperone [Wielerella bovis]MCG7656519.1 CcoQ/FixQ family Cbb3-type cytochrome c oxidase assembly chaperone [Wielerella bovis]MCG7658744.1 CcoQ/FixQ family Cbb3-type cytochrome c oxidase assembly chaperone [Wielerella bovis]ULJ60892.1 CcoQ/FixQ family Cbb3-type cytochrome c oxidase assembly chaperone [Wielerella bovis]ULJ63018.1 CcoQ/FixQ family Cbb3-type cytochrome c oxidase assembly chaperone [Wielerella bovis]ULJ65249.1 CcoQ/FixQ f
MDLNWARTLFTVCVFISFMLVLCIVFNKRNKSNYQDAANSIIDDADTPMGDTQSSRENGA